jgi:hypothetical protein
VEDECGDAFVEVDVGAVAQHLVEDVEGYGDVGDVDGEGLDHGGELALQVAGHHSQLLLLHPPRQQLVHVQQHLQLVGQQVVPFHVLEPQVLRVDLFDEACEQEVDLVLVAEAEQEHH